MQKREEVSAHKERVEGLARKLDHAQKLLFAAEAEADELLEFLKEQEGEGTLIEYANSEPGQSVQEEGVPQLPTVPVTFVKELSGGAIRREVIRMASEINDVFESFTVDDVLASLEKEGYRLNVQSPKVRISQILSSEDIFKYDEQHKAWKMIIPAWLSPKQADDSL